jgi:hypothetical protein
MEGLISPSVSARELDRRAFGLIKKVASAFLGREDLSEREMDEFIARALEGELDAYVASRFMSIAAELGGVLPSYRREYGIDELD